MTSETQDGVYTLLHFICLATRTHVATVGTHASHTALHASLHPNLSAVHTCAAYAPLLYFARRSRHTGLFCAALVTALHGAPRISRNFSHSFQ